MIIKAGGIPSFSTSTKTIFSSVTTSVITIISGSNPDSSFTTFMLKSILSEGNNTSLLFTVSL